MENNFNYLLIKMGEKNDVIDGAKWMRKMMLCRCRTNA